MKKILLLATTATLLTSCILQKNDYKPQNHYDFGNPEQTKSTNLSVGRITSSAHIGRKMQIRRGNAKIDSSDYHTWIANPESLLSDYLKLAFQPSTTAKVISANIIRLETDEDNKSVVMVIDYQLKDSDSSVSYRFEAKRSVNEITVNSSISAFHQMVEQLVNEVNTKL